MITSPKNESQVYLTRKYGPVQFVRGTQQFEKKQVRTPKQKTQQPTFDLLEELRGQPRLDVEAGTIELYNIPAYILANVERLIAGSTYSTESALNCLIENSSEWINQSSAKKDWDSLRKAAISRDQGFEDDDDFDLVYQLCNSFKFKVPDLGNDVRKVRKFRIFPELKSKVCAVADVLGISSSELCKILLVKSLSECEDIVHKSDITKIASSFVPAIEKRIRLVVAMLKALRIKPSADTRRIMDKVPI